MVREKIIFLSLSLRNNKTPLHFIRYMCEYSKTGGSHSNIKSSKKGKSATVVANLNKHVLGFWRVAGWQMVSHFTNTRAEHMNLP